LYHYDIRWHSTDLAQGVQEDEIELDIDELSNEVLHKLLLFVRKYAPMPNDPPEPRQTVSATSANPPSKPKKNKPMSKTEQEAKIAEIKGKLEGYGLGTSEMLPEAGKSLLQYLDEVRCFET
jgi:bromodomain-containing factor 1